MSNTKSGSGVIPGVSDSKRLGSMIAAVPCQEKPNTCPDHEYMFWHGFMTSSRLEVSCLVKDLATTKP